MTHTFHMTNAELSSAIESTAALADKSNSLCDMYAQHLEKPLQIQLQRAQFCFIQQQEKANDL
jgi:hypothetical protein